MKKFIQKIGTVLFIASSICGLAFADPVLFVVGDSTVSEFNDTSYFYPRYGYGTQIANNLSDKITVKNLALSGRSSKSFIKEPEYETLKNEIKKGDFLVIGFGHNDEKSDDSNRFTDANKKTTDSKSFKYSLYENYVKLAENAGATPILCSPIVRISKDNDYSGKNGHITDTGNYGKAVVELGKEKNIQVVDLTSLTANLYKKLKFSGAKYFHAVSGGKSEVEPDFGKMDGTHINIFGAKMISYLFAKAISESNCPLKEFVALKAEPTKENDLQKNPKYSFADYEPADWTKYKASEIFAVTSENWKGTAFGDCGADPLSKPNGFVAKESSAGIFTVGQNSKSPKGKISANSDGLAFAFQQIPVSKNFTLTAKAKVASVAKPGKTAAQAAFGLMLRDDCYVPGNNAVDTNYVAAGLYVESDSSCAVNFSREASMLKLSDDKADVYKAGDTVEFKIERVGQVVTVTTIYGEKTFTKVYTDFDFTAKDNDFFYAGMFGTHGTTAEFTDVVLTITGESQGA